MLSFRTVYLPNARDANNDAPTKILNLYMSVSNLRTLEVKERTVTDYGSNGI